MKRIRVMTLLSVLLMTIILASISAASPATSYTWTFNSKGKWTKTQDAYLPELTLLELELREPEDLFIDHNNNLYIADTGNSRIVRYSIDNHQIIDVIENRVMKTPRGLFVTDDGNIYVADARAEAVHRFDQAGNLIESFLKPNETAFGKTPFNPARIAVDSKKNMFIIGEGVLNGIIHLSAGGQFLGYFATNKVTLDLVAELQNIFFTDEQLDNLGSRVPLTITNVFVDQENIVYSTTMGLQAEKVLAKHNTAGKNVFSEVRGASDLIDLYVDPRGIIYAASLTGIISIYSPDGEFIHSFGGFYGKEDISGLFTELGSLAVDRDGRIWAADSSTSYLQSFVPTDYANTIYRALHAFKLGNYQQTKELWHTVLARNQMLRLAHEGIGKVYLYTQQYKEAMHHLEIANSKFYYSQAYWEVRNIWLQENLAMLITALVILLIVMRLLRRLDKQYQIFDFYRNFGERVRKNQLLADLLFLFDFFKHPIDSFYDLKKGKRGSYLSATIWYLFFFIVYLHARFGRDFLYTPVPVEELDFTALMLGFVVICFLFVLTNYLLSSIQDGDGTLGDIYKLTIYAMGPMITGILVVTGLSYFLSYNEDFLIDLIEFVAPSWSLIILILGLQEVHVYSTGAAVKSIVLSIASMVMIAIVVLIVVMMGEQLADFLQVIVKEVLRNVTN